MILKFIVKTKYVQYSLMYLQLFYTLLSEVLFDIKQHIGPYTHTYIRIPVHICIQLQYLLNIHVNTSTNSHQPPILEVFLHIQCACNCLPLQWQRQCIRVQTYEYIHGCYWNKNCKTVMAKQILFLVKAPFTLLYKYLHNQTHFTRKKS